VVVPKAGSGAAASAAAAAAAGATQLHKAAGSAPVITTGAAGVPAAPAAPLLKPERRGPPLLLLAGAGAILFLLVIVGGAFALTNGFGLMARPSATATDRPTLTAQAPTSTNEPAATATVRAGTNTPDAVATQFAAIQETQAALVAGLATSTPTQTPDLTATALACTYDFEVVAQDPADGSTFATGAAKRKTLTISNTGVCAYPAGTLLTETVPSTGLAPIALELPAIEPGAQDQVSFDWPGLRQAGTMTRVFEVHLPDGTVVGNPLTFTFKYAVAATQRPANTNTPVPPAATATKPAATGLTDIYPGPTIGCVYQGDGGIDYNCTLRLGWGGQGTGRMTLYLDGQQVGAFNSAAGEQMYYNVVSRRCFGRSYNLRLVDDATATQKSGDFFFDPVGNAASFPGGGCTQ
jgi:hypothetical protein